MSGQEKDYAKESETLFPAFWVRTSEFILY